MSTYLLTWNPAKWTFQDWPQALADMAQKGFYIRPWSCVSKKPVTGDTVLLKKTGNGLTGIIASGTVLSPPYENSHWGKNMEATLKQYVQVKFDRLTDYTKGHIFRVNDKADFGFIPQASGCVLDEVKASSLIERFHAYAAAPIIVPPIVLAKEQKRVGISLKLRYHILDRDAHTCRYCGDSPPKVVLVVDHVISQKSWREKYGNLEDVNALENLVTACEPCNAGKSARNGKPPQTRVS